MKAQQRHELHSNYLADWLEDTFEKLKPYARAIVGVLAAAAIIICIYAYVSSVERRGMTAASDQFVGALDDFSQLPLVIEENRGTQPAVLAQLMLAESQLRQATDLQYSNKPVAKESLLKAADAFAQVEQSTRDPLLRGWAMYGEGRARESMGELDRAKTFYQNLISMKPDSAFKEAAQRHLDQLDRTSTKEFYDWFAKQDPRPPAVEKEPGTPGSKLPFDLSPPSTGDIKFPTSPDSGFPVLPGDNKAPETTPADAPKDSGMPAKDSAPSQSSASPAEDKATDAAKPADTGK